MEKVIRDGKVAVLYSPGFGAGWYTWNYNNEWNKKLIFHPELVKMVEEGRQNEIDEEIVQKLLDLPEDEYVSTSGAYELEIAWIDEGTAFVIQEYDGSESIETADSLTIIA